MSDLAGFRGLPASAPRREGKSEAQSARVVVPFEDNRLLTHLLGEFDSHLAHRSKTAWASTPTRTETSSF